MLHLTYLILDSSLTLDNSPVLQSQVLDKLQNQAASGIKVGLVTSVENEFEFENIWPEQLQGLDVPIVTFRHRSLLKTVWSGARALRCFQSNHPSNNVYVRGIWGALAHLIAFPIGGPQLIYDFRGDGVAEAESRGRSGPRMWVLKMLTRFFIRRADQLLCISHPAAKTLSLKYGRQDAVVFPSAVDAEQFGAGRVDRAKKRAELGLRDDDILLVYAGGINAYQMIPEMLNIWASLGYLPYVRYLLLLSKQPSPDERPSWESIIPPSRIATATVQRNEVPAYLAASDVGFLLRQNHPLNNVASPVKFGEYLASGLAVVTSPDLGDVSRIVEDHKLGILIDPDDIQRSAEACSNFLEMVKEDRDGFVYRSQNAVETENMSWPSHLDLWRKLLGLDTSETVLS